MTTGKKRVKKTEKYITERISKAGTCSLEICVRMNGQTFRENVRIDDYPTPAKAMKAACKKRDEAIRKIRAGYTVSNFPTVEALYMKSYEVLKPVRIRTRIRNDEYYNNGISKYGERSIDKITAADIQASVNKYAESHTSGQTSHFLSMWRRIYKTAMMMNIEIPDRTSPVSVPQCKENNTRGKEISPKDLDTFCNVLLEYRNASVSGRYESRCIWYAIQVMRYCGIRPAEAFALTKNDIHLSSSGMPYISINKAARSTNNELLTLSDTKTEQSKRNVPIPAALEPILIDCLSWTRHDLIFADYDGNLMNIDNVCLIVRKVAQKAGVKFNLYMLRHQFSTDLFTAHVSPTVIRDLMGHKSANMSLDYAVSNTNDRIQAINNRRFS